jgi:hypothetical protein
VNWLLDRRFLIAGALVLWGIWAVECLRKLGFIWPWPLVPLAIWVAGFWFVRRRGAGLGSQP